MNKTIMEAHDLEENEGQIPPENWFERSETLQKLRKNKKFPTIWCSGCGLGVVMGALIRAIDHLGLKNDEIALGDQFTNLLRISLSWFVLHRNTLAGYSLTLAVPPYDEFIER